MGFFMTGLLLEKNGSDSPDGAGLTSLGKAI
jgi:hypothetical protein